MPRLHEGISGLLDRKSAYSTVARHVSEAHSEGFPLSVLWIDIDRLRLINQSFGYAGGDKLVQIVAYRLLNLLQSSGDLAHMSADEFVILLPRKGLDAATELAHSIRDALSLPLEIDSVQIYPTVSVGISVLSLSEDALTLLLRADKAKRQAKKNGGHSFTISGERLVLHGAKPAREELEIEAKLHVAINTGCLQLHYQPIVRSDGSIEVIEALMRCTVNGESIPPAKFIAVAEKTGLIVQLGEWTLCEGAYMVRRLMDMGRNIKVAVNVSRAQIVNYRFIEVLHSSILCADIPPHLLELELTESLFLDASEVVQKNLREIREAGVGLAIDDFGTGYSTLATLKDIPATKVKLDRSFILALPGDQKALVVVSAMAHLGRELGLIVVAEGVETAHQLKCLEQIGVDAIQGYFFSPPLPAETLFQWLQNRPLLPVQQVIPLHDC